MKKITALCLAATLALTINASAQADWGRHDGGGYRDYGYRGDYGHHHRHGGGNWFGPAVVLGIAGLAIGTAVASQHYYAAPAQVYAAPAQVYAAPVQVYSAPPVASYGTWYYCGSSGQYYPYTNACPEGWQAVPAR